MEQGNFGNNHNRICSEITAPEKEKDGIIRLKETKFKILKIFLKTTMSLVNKEITFQN